MRSSLLLAALCLLPAALAAEADPGAAKFRVEDATLIYDTEQAGLGDDAEITTDDIDRLLTILRDTPGIETLRLNSSGGSVYAGDEMARIVIDFGLDTEVAGLCSSSCVNIFLGGAARRMQRGSKIGFHQRHWPVEAMEAYYESWREEKGWETPFDFASWVYRDTQSETYADLSYMIARGVDAGFAVETKKVIATDEWFPSRIELVEAGVLRDAP